ncbi:hypothetical protein ABT084_20690 [Streptomyces sp. NPDC002138]|uniref:hypothetical protein n=1 Tax=Streptomyces sp. NPDC002138 TaxID=3154410 RepID=UPI003324F177
MLLLGTLCDAPHGHTRVTEVARITAYESEPVVREPDLFARWEWRTPSALRSLPQPLFAASAQALNVVWPGLLPDVPAAHHTPRPATSALLKCGEPPTAVRLRERLVRHLNEARCINTPALQGVFTAVPRHAFLPEQPMERAYSDEAVATVCDEVTGRSMSSVSQPAMQALMLRWADPRLGHTVLEIGGGGYNTALAAELVGPQGSVVCVEIDPYVHARTVRFLAETGYAERVRPVLGDGAHGAPEHLVPAGGFDALVLTVAANDVLPAWTAQLADGGRLVLPLRIGGFTRAVGLRDQDGALHSTGISPCGFVPMRGGRPVGRDTGRDRRVRLRDPLGGHPAGPAARPRPGPRRRGHRAVDRGDRTGRRVVPRPPTVARHLAGRLLPHDGRSGAGRAGTAPETDGRGSHRRRRIAGPRRSAGR